MKTIKSFSITFLFLVAMSMEPSKIEAQDTLRGGVKEPGRPISLDYSKHYLAFDGYRWIPGHSVIRGVDTFWVRGIWVRPHNYEYLWTPNVLVYHGVHWLPYITLYTGVNYGYGYGETSYSNDKWEDGISFSF